MDKPFYSGFIAIIGRPNSGKSTLLNSILGEPLAIVSSMPQTTQKNMRGILNRDDMQLIFVDTPGIHKGKHGLNRSMYDLSISMIDDDGVDLVCYMIDLSRDFGEEEDGIAERVSRISGDKRAVIVFNKVDQFTIPEVEEKKALFYERYPELGGFPNVMLSSVAENAGEIFVDFIKPYIPEGPQYYPEGDLTDANLRFFASEYVRKQIINITYEEVPHACHVEITDYEELDDMHTISADIHVETPGQKGIIIGDKGKNISKIRKGAEWRMRKLVGMKVKFNLFVKITPHWRDKKERLREFGFSE